MITLPTSVTRILFVVPSFALIFSCMPSDAPDRVTCMALASPDCAGSVDEDPGFSPRLSGLKLTFAQPESAPMHSESAPMHFLAADNLGLARLFISKVFVDRYSRAAFSEALAALRPGHEAFVQAVQAYEACIPGMTELHEAINEASEYTLADRVAFFARGAVLLYAFAIAQGGTASGYNLGYVRDHIGVRAGTQQITEVIRVHMPYVIIKVLSEFTQKLKMLYARVRHDELCSQFWVAVSDLDDALITIQDTESLNCEQNAVFKLILAYQKYRISQYQDLYTEQVSALGDQKEAALACEEHLLDNGFL
ncbi:MAG: hypothetical protein WCJ17_00510 [bacterium]